MCSQNSRTSLSSSKFPTSQSDVSYDRTRGLTEGVKTLFKNYFLADDHTDCLGKEQCDVAVRVRHVLPSQRHIICCINDASVTSEGEDGVSTKCR